MNLDGLRHSIAIVLVSLGVSLEWGLFERLASVWSQVLAAWVGVGVVPQIRHGFFLTTDREVEIYQMVHRQTLLLQRVQP